MLQLSLTWYDFTWYDFRTVCLNAGDGKGRPAEQKAICENYSLCSYLQPLSQSTLPPIWVLRKWFWRLRFNLHDRHRRRVQINLLGHSETQRTAESASVSVVINSWHIYPVHCHRPHHLIIQIRDGRGFFCITNILPVDLYFVLTWAI